MLGFNSNNSCSLYKNSFVLFSKQLAKRIAPSTDGSNMFERSLERVFHPKNSEDHSYGNVKLPETNRDIIQTETGLLLNLAYKS